VIHLADILTEDTCVIQHTVNNLSENTCDSADIMNYLTVTRDNHRSHRMCHKMYHKRFIFQFQAANLYNCHLIQ